jgi:DNA-directed RNA polymerase specialized sigma24 family protein
MGRSFDEAFEAEFASLHRYLARRLGASAADDLAEETFAVAFRSWARLDPERPVRPWLHAWAELTDSEIAVALGLPLGTVRSRLSRRREKLRNRLSEVGQEAVEAS